MDANAKDKLKLVGKDQLRDIEAYKAETDRFKALAMNCHLIRKELRQIVEQLVGDALQTNLKDVTESAQAETDEDSPDPVPEHPSQQFGGRQAPDGEWYITDPTRRSKFLRIAPLAQEHSRPGIVSGA